MIKTIWDIYLDPDWRAGYARQLEACGYKRVEIQDIMSKFGIYLDRLKSSYQAITLSAARTKDEFHEKLDYIFNVLWKDHIQNNYSEMHYHFVAFLDIIDTLQALRGEFISEEDRERLNTIFPTIPIQELTKYETDVMENGKIKILNNPILLSWIRNSLASKLITQKRIPELCEMFYGNLLPEMQRQDFIPLCKQLWDNGGKTRGVRHLNKFHIVFPDGTDSILDPLDALRQVVTFYGPETVRNKKLMVRGKELVIRKPIILQPNYEPIETDYCLYTVGNNTDRRNVIIRINISCGNKLSIE